MLVLALLGGAALGLILGLVLGRRSGMDVLVPAEEPTGDSRADDPPEAVERPWAALLEAGLDALPLGGIVLFGVDGVELRRNDLASEVANGRHNGALVDAAVAEMAVVAAREGHAEQTLPLYGPPKRVYELRALRVVDDGGTPLGVLVSIEDASEPHRVDQVRRDFVANVSHELKTPVAAMGLLAEALAEEDDPETVRRMSERLQNEALRLGNTITDLLTLSELESDVLDVTRVTVAELYDGVRDRSSAAAESRNIQLIWRGDADLWLEGDRRQLVSALGNLVDNAIKYSDPGSQVEIRAEMIEAEAVDGPAEISPTDPAASADGPRIAFAVRDDGIGIPESDRERIFERFYRVDPARSRSTGGTGLGLSIVRHTMLRHGGDVALSSVEGAGTTFWLRLPQRHIGHDGRPAVESLVPKVMGEGTAGVLEDTRADEARTDTSGPRPPRSKASSW